MLLSLLISVLLAHPADTLLSPAYVTAFKERVPLEKLVSPVSIIKADAMSTLGGEYPASFRGLSLL